MGASWLWRGAVLSVGPGIWVLKLGDCLTVPVRSSGRNVSGEGEAH